MSLLSRNSQRHVRMEALVNSSPSAAGKFTLDGSFNLPQRFSGVTAAEAMLVQIRDT